MAVLFKTEGFFMDNECLEITLSSLDDNVRFAGQARANPEVTIDYFPPFGMANGYTSLELLLISFSSCVSSTLAIILSNQMKRNVKSLNAKAKGYVRDEHPKVISNIELELFIESSDADGEDVGKALAAMENKLCPVWAMLKDTVKIAIMFKISR